MSGDLNSHVREQHRLRPVARQALAAIVASLVAIGAIHAIGGTDDTLNRLAASPIDSTDIDIGTVATEPAATDTIPSTDTISSTGAIDAGAIETGAASDETVPIDTALPAGGSTAVSTAGSADGAAAGSTTATMPSSTQVAPAPTDLPAVDATAFAVFDASSSTWMAEQQADTPLAVGSVIKLLTSYVVLQAGDLAKTVTVPDLQVDISESAIGLYAGEQLPRDALLRAMLIVSANDAARALATDVGGSIDGFVGQMNAAAADLGLTNTVAANPIGLDASGAHSSARDMVNLAALLMQDPTFAAAVARPSANLHGQTFAATNKLLTTYPGATGVKTGHTTQAGYCLVASATREGRTVYVAVLGAPTDAQRLAGATALLDWAFAHP